MPDIVLVLLKFAFLGLLYIFVARAVRAVVLELRGGATPEQARAPAPRSPKRVKKVPRKAVIVEGSSTSGKTFELNDEVILGRGEKCHVVLDDTYVSTVHARLFPKSEGIFVEDLGSTNGTYLNRRRVTAAVEVQRGDHVKVGKTILEMRK